MLPVFPFSTNSTWPIQSMSSNSNLPMTISNFLTLMVASLPGLPSMEANTNLGEFYGMPVMELLSICLNLTLLLVFLFIISARQFRTCVGRIRLLKDDSDQHAIPYRGGLDREASRVDIGNGFKISMLCCFGVLCKWF